MRCCGCLLGDKSKVAPRTTVVYGIVITHLLAAEVNEADMNFVIVDAAIY